MGFPMEIKRKTIKHLSYEEWCKKERLPQDKYTRAIYNHWKRSIPQLQGIIDDIVTGYLSKAHRDLGKYLSAFNPERFRA